MASSTAAATPLLYSCIAYHNTVLTEHTISSVSGTSGLASVILPKIQHETAQKLTYTHNENFIHYIADASPSSANSDSLSAGGLTYMVVAKADLGRRIPFGYLVEIKKRFLKEYNPERTNFGSLPAYGAAAFNGQLKQLMVEYGTTKAGKDDAFANVQNQIDNVRGIMTENIERVLERGERIDLLVDKTDRLGGSARDFRVRSTGLRRKMWWKNMRLMVIMVVVIIFLVYLLVGFGCGLPAWGRQTSIEAGFGALPSYVTLQAEVHERTMPFYEVKHTTPLTVSQKDELANAITTIHSTKFSTPKLFVNVEFQDTSNASTYVGGKQKAANHLFAHVRSGPSRRREDWEDLTSQLQAAWDKTVGAGLPKVRRSDPDQDTSLRSIVLMGDLMFMKELGFIVPQAGGDVQWLQENWEEFNKRADAGDDDFKGMVEEVKERRLNESGPSKQQQLEEALGWGDSA
ncbi:hypothetical protein LTR97_003545 [Elasticomyces elasticus]|uniref:Synaptobrevin homolog YKT6 n=1 Tax=Elasticomyces elasticus TaxID=574655 RepID=A0AAN7WE88_9PEZI|nr:hypothetical protein LTR97_003545 [Elasticomyces elasticus]